MSKDPIEAEVEVVSTSKSKSKKPKSKPTQNKQQEENPFAAFGAGGAGMEGMPDLSAMFGGGGMPDLSKLPGLPLKQRIMFKVMGWLNSPKLRFLKSKWSIPIWGLIAIAVLAIALTLGLIFLAFKLIKALLKPYFQLFSKKRNSH